MILYVNGCSHTAAAEAVVPECFAVDDGRYGIDRRPHPVNLSASWCTYVARKLAADMICEAESGGSNARILRTTRDWIDANLDKWEDTVIILQWTTWEREEWLHEDRWFQVNASGTDWVPDALLPRYKQFVVDVDWPRATAQAHDQIWQLHQELLSKRIRHLFFNGQWSLGKTANRYNWYKYYIDPYNDNQSYANWLIQNGGSYARPGSYHFDAKSHRLWGENVLHYINRNQILEPINEVLAD